MTTGARAVERDLAAPPAALLNEVEERCRALAATAAGRVYTVPAEAAEAALEVEAGRGARHDTILSFMCTPQVVSLEGYIASIERILADEGWILMVEPAWLDRGRSLKWLTARRRPQSPRRSDGGQDLVSAVRSCGLVLTDVHRREARSVEPEWCQYVVLRARRASPPLPGS
jgi:hypothetical protein